VADDIQRRKHERVDFFRRASWDFFEGATGRKQGYIADVSRGGCLLKTSEAIDHRRWVRIIIQDEQTNLCITAVGRVVRRQQAMEVVNGGTDVTLYNYGIEFTFPGYFSLAGTNLTLALSSKNWMVRSCRSRNSKSSFLPGVLA